MSSANPVAEIHWKIWSERALNTGESYTCEYVTLFQLCHRVALRMHWYVAQKF